MTYYYHIDIRDLILIRFDDLKKLVSKQCNHTCYLISIYEIIILEEQLPVITRCPELPELPLYTTCVRHLKLKKIHKCLLCPYKRQISMQRFIALLQEYGHIRTWHIYNTGKTLYIWIETVWQSFYYNWKTNNKSCKIMWRLSTSTCIRYVLVVCAIQPSLWHALPAA